MLIDHQLENRKIKLKQPLLLDIGVGSLKCNEQISISWVGKGNMEHGTSTFYVLPRGQGYITNRIILSKEWLDCSGLLYDKDTSGNISSP
jgi:hypothetical protein